MTHRTMLRSPHTVRVLTGHPNLDSNCQRMQANFRLSHVSGYMTELLEIRAQNPPFHVLFIPGNPGVVTFYKDFVERLHELLGGTASITAVGHISHTKKNWEHGSLFSLQEQIDHKVDFMKDELQNIGVPIILVGHSIGSYISIETFRSFKQVIYCIGLYPFLALNTESSKQSMIGKIAVSPILCATLSSIVGLLGLLPNWTSRFIVKKSLGKSWCPAAVEATCTHLLQYHVMRNVLFMAMTEFNRVSKQARDIALSIEREGHTHGFCCTEAGSSWVAQHVASLIRSCVAAAEADKS